MEKDGVTTEWLTSVIKKVSQSLSSCREKLEQQKTATNTCWVRFFFIIIFMLVLFTKDYFYINQLMKLMSSKILNLTNICVNKSKIYANSGWPQAGKTKNYQRIRNFWNNQGNNQPF